MGFHGIYWDDVGQATDDNSNRSEPGDGGGDQDHIAVYGSPMVQVARVEEGEGDPVAIVFET